MDRLRAVFCCLHHRDAAMAFVLIALVALIAFGLLVATVFWFGVMATVAALTRE